MLKNYLLTAYKVFMRRKLFTLINLLCIVLTLVVLMVVTALLENAFYPTGVEGKSERFLQVLVIEARSPNGKMRHTSPLGYKVIEQYLKPMRSVERVAAVTLPRTVSVYQDGNVSELEMRRADADYWKILDFTVLKGRLPTADDDDAGRLVAVVNASSARKLFPGADALGQAISVSGQQFTIIGVVQDEMQLNAYADIWAPITSFPSSDYRKEFNGEFAALILAKRRADLPAIRAEVERIAKGVVFDDPKKWSRALFYADSKIDMFARMTIGNQDSADSGATTMLGAIIGVMFLFMLLPALNLVNLNTGRIMERSAEIGVRKAFGATSAQLIGQLVIENVLLCLAGGVLGMLCAQGVLWWLEQSNLIPYLRVSINVAVLAWSLLITVVFGLLSGVLPAWKMARLDPVHALKGNT
jgi:putative ABC transport system permease protein